MKRDDQEMVNFYHRLIKKAAQHKLVVNFHGSYKPTGISRTYPNLLTREGVLGNEYSKWSKRITPEHTTILPFTRGILGSMDYTVGGFVNAYPEDFKNDISSSPMVMGTRCNQLAMLVVFESSIQTMCDSPFNYRNSPAGTDFLKIVPTNWDETKFIHGLPGEFITVARRKGDDWYVGSMSNEEARNLDLPLDFLGEGKYIVKIWRDVISENAKATDLEYLEKEVDKTTIIQANLSRGGGGHVMVIEKKSSN
jgi:alpha-glucosidase